MLQEYFDRVRTLGSVLGSVCLTSVFLGTKVYALVERLNRSSRDLRGRNTTTEAQKLLKTRKSAGQIQFFTTLAGKCCYAPILVIPWPN